MKDINLLNLYKSKKYINLLNIYKNIKKYRKDFIYTTPILNYSDFSKGFKLCNNNN